jgi:hypothetical protein
MGEGGYQVGILDFLTMIPGGEVTPGMEIPIMEIIQIHRNELTQNVLLADGRLTLLIENNEPSIHDPGLPNLSLQRV